jgi:hypothetical protein
MASSCCKLVGDLNLGIDGCIISINTNCATESSVACGDTQPQEGPSTGTLSITGYAMTQLWIGCPSKAGVNIPYIRKYDCVEDVVYFIPNGQGQSFTSGDAGSVASVKYALSTCNALSASSSSGPATIYMETEQINGYGLSYTGGPISIDTTPAMEPIVIPGFGGSTGVYLQSFNFEAQPGALPTASYSFVYGL